MPGTSKTYSPKWWLNGDESHGRKHMKVKHHLWSLYIFHPIFAGHRLLDVNLGKWPYCWEGTKSIDIFCSLSCLSTSRLPKETRKCKKYGKNDEPFPGETTNAKESWLCCSWWWHIEMDWDVIQPMEYARKVWTLFFLFPQLKGWPPFGWVKSKIAILHLTKRT